MNELEKKCITEAIEYILTDKSNLEHNKRIYESLMILKKYNIFKFNKDSLSKMNTLYGK